MICKVSAENLMFLLERISVQYTSRPAVKEISTPELQLAPHLNADVLVKDEKSECFLAPKGSLFSTNHKSPLISSQCSNDTPTMFYLQVLQVPEGLNAIS